MRFKCELIIERDGVIIYRGQSRSFVKNFGIILAGMLKNSGLGDTTKYVAVVNTSGNIANAPIEDIIGSSYTYYSPMAFSSGDNDDSYGIVVGSGSTPVSPDDYALASKIPHGTGAGQIDYNTHTVTSSYSDTSSYIEISRSFTNRSGSDIIVREVGLIARSYHTYRNVDIRVLVARDVLTNPIVVPNLSSLTVRYRITLSL